MGDLAPLPRPNLLRPTAFGPEQTPGSRATIPGYPPYDGEPRDLLVTSGLGGAFPAGYPVAVVENVVRIPQQPFADVTARPASALDQVREVMLIWQGAKAAAEEVEPNAEPDAQPFAEPDNE